MSSGTLRRSASVLGAAMLLTSLLAAVWFVTTDRSHELASERDVVLAQADEEDDETVTSTSLSPDVTYDVFLARDPFESIRPPEPEEATAPADPITPAPGTTIPPAPGTPSTPGTPSQPGDNGAADGKDPNGICRTGSEAVCDGTVVDLKGVTDGRAHVEINGVPFIVGPGETFAVNFQVLRIDGDCVEFLYLEGDQADVFRLCVGGAVVK